MGRFPWVSGLVSWPPGPVLESVLLWLCSCRQKSPCTMTLLSYLAVKSFRTSLKHAEIGPESLCAGLWAPCRVFWFWFGPASGPNPVRNRRCPAGSFKVFGALYLLSDKQPFYILVFGSGQELATKRHCNWSTGLILGEFCIIYRARPV